MWVRKSQQEEVWAELLETTAFSIAPPKWRPKLSQRNNFYFLSCNLSERQSSFLLPIQTNGVLGGPRHVVASSSSLITPLHPKMCIPMLLFSVSTPKNHQYLFRILSLAWERQGMEQRDRVVFFVVFSGGEMWAFLCAVKILRGPISDFFSSAYTCTCELLVPWHRNANQPCHPHQ